MYRTRSITLPIVLATVTVVVAVALLVGWIVLVRRGAYQGSAPAWLLVAGGLGLGTVATVLVLLSSFQVREILENRRQSRFLDSVTHELKSPLASLRLCLDTLQRPGLDPAQRATLHRMMREDVDRLEAFIDDVLAASRLAGERRLAERAPVRLEPLVRRVAARAAARHGAPEAVSVAIAPDLEVLADPMALEVVLRNLLDNAVKYSDHPVRVEVTAEAAPGGRVHVVVRDEGIGIPPDQLRKVFQRFHRGDDEAVRERPGTGLGLYVCRALVRSMGGRLSLASEGPGRGTTARVDLPAVQEAPVPEEDAG